MSSEQDIDFAWALRKHRAADGATWNETTWSAYQAAVEAALVLAKTLGSERATHRALVSAAEKVLASPAIADGDFTSAEWGCHDSAKAEGDLRAALAASKEALGDE